MNADTLLRSIQNLVENPTSNLVATSLALAILVIALLILVLVALILLMPRQSRHQDPSVDPATPEDAATPVDSLTSSAQHGVRARPRFVLTPQHKVIALSLGILIAAAALHASTSANEYCANTCHNMVAAADSWDSSTHSDVRCIDCHETSLIDAAASRIRHAYMSVTAPDTSTEATVRGTRCLGCHESVLEGTVTSERGVIVEHRHIIESGMDCTRCHEGVGHTGSTTTRQGTMSDCLRCHNGESAGSACAICHEGDVAQAAVDDRVFGKVSLPAPTCGGCHSQESCDACHGLRMPHPTDYADPHQHAQPAAFSGREKLCYRCHTRQDCGQCHNDLDAGHPPGWLYTHRSYTLQDGEGYCLACHKTSEFCGVCHE